MVLLGFGVVTLINQAKCGMFDSNVFFVFVHEVFCFGFSSGQHNFEIFVHLSFRRHDVNLQNKKKSFNPYLFTIFMVDVLPASPFLSDPPAGALSFVGATITLICLPDMPSGTF